MYSACRKRKLPSISKLPDFDIQILAAGVQATPRKIDRSGIIHTQLSFDATHDATFSLQIVPFDDLRHVLSSDEYILIQLEIDGQRIAQTLWDVHANKDGYLFHSAPRWGEYQPFGNQDGDEDVHGRKRAVTIRPCQLEEAVELGWKPLRFGTERIRIAMRTLNWDTVDVGRMKKGTQRHWSFWVRQPDGTSPEHRPEASSMASERSAVKIKHKDDGDSGDPLFLPGDSPQSSGLSTRRGQPGPDPILGNSLFASSTNAHKRALDAQDDANEPARKKRGHIGPRIAGICTPKTATTKTATTKTEDTEETPVSTLHHFGQLIKDEDMGQTVKEHTAARDPNERIRASTFCVPPGSEFNPPIPDPPKPNLTGVQKRAALAKQEDMMSAKPSLPHMSITDMVAQLLGTKPSLSPSPNVSTPKTPHYSKTPTSSPPQPSDPKHLANGERPTRSIPEARWFVPPTYTFSPTPLGRLERWLYGPRPFQPNASEKAQLEQMFKDLGATDRKGYSMNQLKALTKVLNLFLHIEGIRGDVLSVQTTARVLLVRFGLNIFEWKQQKGRLAVALRARTEETRWVCDCIKKTIEKENLGALR